MEWHGAKKTDLLNEVEGPENVIFQQLQATSELLQDQN